MWRDQTGAASRPHKKRGNRISPSGERSKTKLGFFFFINSSAVKQSLSPGWATMLLFKCEQHSSDGGSQGDVVGADGNHMEYLQSD